MRTRLRTRCGNCSELPAEQKDLVSLLGSTPAHRFTDKCMYCGRCAPCTVEIDIASVNKFADLCVAPHTVPASSAGQVKSTHLPFQ